MNPHARRFLIGFLALVSMLAGAGSSRAFPAAQAEDRAAVVVQFPGGEVRSYCVAVGGESATGLDLLLRTGLDVKVEAYGGMGALVCKIGPTGCDYPDQPCVCQSYGQGGVYWSYHHLKDGAWKTAITGAGAYKVKPGEVDGWAWSSGAPPPVVSFGKVCPAKATPTTDDRPPVTAVPTATQALQPTATRRPAPSATPTRKPAPTSTPTTEAAPTQPPLPPPSEAPATAAPSETPTPTPTETPTLTATPLPSATSTPPVEPSPTVAPSPTPTAIPQPAPADGAALARTVGGAIGIGVVAALAVWGGLLAVRRRNASGSNRTGGDVD